MFNLSRRPARCAGLFFVLLASFPALGVPGAVIIERAWARTSVINTGAVYLTLRNAGPTPSTLTGIDCAPLGACMMHESREHDGMTSMVMLDKLVIAAGASASFLPRGKHIMVEELKKPLLEGTAFPITLHFREIPDMQVQIHVSRQEPEGN